MWPYRVIVASNVFVWNLNAPCTGNLECCLYLIISFNVILMATMLGTAVRACALQCGHIGTRVTCLCPGRIKTEIEPWSNPWCFCAMSMFIIVIQPGLHLHGQAKLREPLPRRWTPSWKSAHWLTLNFMVRWWCSTICPPPRPPGLSVDCAHGPRLGRPGDKKHHHCCCECPRECSRQFCKLRRLFLQIWSIPANVPMNGPTHLTSVWKQN